MKCHILLDDMLRCNNMDDLNYKYENIANGYTRNTNRLRHVNDNTGYTSNYNTDIDDQGTYGIGNENYAYDQIGNLIKDKSEDILNINWTLSGKVKDIIREEGSIKPDISFKYDAMGRRISKIVKPRDENGLKPENEWTTTHYIYDASGNILAMYDKTNNQNYKLAERYIYGSSRLGIDITTVDITNSDDENIHKLTKGNRNYELSNFRGDVLTVITDRKIPVADIQNPGLLSHSEADIISTSDIYPFGMQMPGRSFNSPMYRFGFNGQEKDDEITGVPGAHTTAMFWEYDTRIGRRWNLDPKPNPCISQYATFALNPIWFSDPLGDTLRIQGDKKFIAQTNENIEKIRATDLGAELLAQLESSKKTYNITEAMNKFGAEFEPTRGGGDVDYDPTPWRDELEGGAYNGLIGLSHELNHAYDYDVGNIKVNKDGTMDKSQKVIAETNALKFQNYITKSYDLGKTRNSYGDIRNIGSYGGVEKITNFKYDGSSVSFVKTRTTLNTDFTVKTTKKDITRSVILNSSHTPWYYKY